MAKSSTFISSMFKQVLNDYGIPGDCVINSIANYFGMRYKRVYRLAKKYIPGAQFFEKPDSGISLSELIYILLRLKSRRIRSKLWIWEAKGELPVWKLSKFNHRMFVACHSKDNDTSHGHLTVFKHGNLRDRDVMFMGYNVCYVVTTDSKPMGPEWDALFSPYF